MILSNFFKDIEILDFDNETVVFGLNISEDVIAKTKIYFDENIKKAIKEIFQKDLIYKMYDKRNKTKNLINEKNKTKVLTENTDSKRKKLKNNIDKDFTFDSYVVSDFNAEAIEACKSLITNEKKLSPIFIQASSGLGKTHLLHAIGNEFIKLGKTAVHINPNTFTREITFLLQENDPRKLTLLTNLYTEADLVMFDDIQLFGVGQKKSTINFIFQIIDNRIQKEKPTIFACETSIQSLKGIFDERIITRFSFGFSTQIKPLNKEDLEKILSFFLERFDVDLKLIDLESRNFLIRNNSNNVRAIYGAVKRVSYFKKELENTNYVYDVICNAFKGIIKEIGTISPDTILDAVSKYYKIPKKDMLGKTRKKEVIIARHIAMSLIKMHLKLTLEEIGKIFNKDHSTVINAIRKIESQENDKSLKNALSYLNEEIFKLN
ncbi:chromosomal replication initiator protein DnaA [Mycoplasma crocodyli MP145]|uniref:Chromosomal replication initiator protein DnaA n=2 Tax=Mycoplasma TaxID=2093 RepID=D5E4J2_MYCCM|nr:chromosomal replication initiator protein DnaA [Mycoplasma crocodyli MP145]